MGAARIKTFYQPILESCEEASDRGASSDQIRARAAEKIGRFLTSGELKNLRTPTPHGKGNYFEWGLADLVQYEFLTKNPLYKLTAKGWRLVGRLRQNPTLQIDRPFLAQF